jgi:hypothetical protein
MLLQKGCQIAVEQIPDLGKLDVRGEIQQLEFLDQMHNGSAWEALWQPARPR